MGLHIQRHQTLPPESRLCPSRPSLRHNDLTLHGRLCQTPHQDLSQKRRARNGWYGSTEYVISRHPYLSILFEKETHKLSTVPIKTDKEANDKAMASVAADKLREVKAGHDGTWVAHPALAQIALDVFDEHMPTPNQLFRRTGDINITSKDLLNMNVPGTITEDGIRKNLTIGIAYMEAWLRGSGCVPINYLMEDAATAEVSRSQLWQWCKHGVQTAEGKKVDKEYAQRLLKEQTEELENKAGQGNKFQLAAKYFKDQITGEGYGEFLTTLLYDEITSVTDARPAAEL